MLANRFKMLKAAVTRYSTTTTTTIQQQQRRTLTSAFEQSIKSSLSSHPIIPPQPTTSTTLSPFSLFTPSPSPPTPPTPPTPTTSSSTLLLSRLSRLLMRHGHLSRSQTHLTTLLSSLSLLTSSPPLPLLLSALSRCSPQIRLVNRRKGTKALPTPQPLTEEQKVRQAWMWIVEASEKRKGEEKVFGKRLAKEVVAVLQGNSEAIKKMEGRHLQAVTARANVGR